MLPFLPFTYICCKVTSLYKTFGHPFVTTTTTTHNFITYYNPSKIIIKTEYQ